MSKWSSKATNAARLIALVGLVVLVAAIAGVQAGVLSSLHAFFMFVAAALLGGGLASILGVVGWIGARGGDDPRAGRHALVALIVGVPMFGVAVASSLPGRGLPPINDITTSLDNPPQFVAAQNLPANVGRDMNYPEAFKPLVRAAYADLATIVLSEGAPEVFARVRNAANALGWMVTKEDMATGLLEATSASAWFKFTDDIVVRIAAGDSSTVIDVRSKSRDGKNDFGVNARRIRAFTASLGGS
jgi:hypothetical protein